MKRLISLLLAVLMLTALISAFILPASAEDEYSVGQWVITKKRSTKHTEYSQYECIIGDKHLFYYIAYYLVDNKTETILSTLTYSVPVSSVYDTDQSTIPDFVQELAEQKIASFESTGSSLSQGKLWIIIAVSVLAIGGVGALVIVKKKKKKALSSGTENTDEE